MPLPLSFLDSNVLIYASDASDPVRQAIAQRLYIDLVTDNALVLSAQVLNELYKNLTNPRKSSTRPAVSHTDTVEIISHLIADAKETVSVSPTVCLRGYHLNDRHRMQLWDALILSAAIEAKAAVLYTEDVPGAADPKTGLLEGIRYVNPFVPIAAGTP
jgi:predicted nucleic acid-binding protein